MLTLKEESGKLTIKQYHVGVYLVGMAMGLLGLAISVVAYSNLESSQFICGAILPIFLIIIGIMLFSVYPLHSLVVDSSTYLVTCGSRSLVSSKKNTFSFNEIQRIRLERVYVGRPTKRVPMLFIKIIDKKNNEIEVFNGENVFTPLLDRVFGKPINPQTAAEKIAKAIAVPLDQPSEAVRKNRFE